MTDLIDKHDAGWVANDNDIVSAINEILNTDSNILAEKGRNAQILVREELDWKKITKILLKEVERLWLY